MLVNLVGNMFLYVYYYYFYVCLIVTNANEYTHSYSYPFQNIMLLILILVINKVIIETTCKCLAIDCEIKHSISLSIIGLKG